LVSFAALSEKLLRGVNKMDFTFETIGSNTFLVYRIQPQDTLDTMTLGMITKNRIPGMAPVIYTQANLDRFLKYNVTAKINVKKFFSGAVNRRRLLGVFASITAALNAAEEYMIDVNSLLLDVDDIYVDVTTSRAEVICLPVMNADVRTDMGMFFKNIMFTTQFDQTENCDYVAAIINYLNSSPVFVAEDFGRLIDKLQEQPAAVQTWGASEAAQPRMQPGEAQFRIASIAGQSQTQPIGGQMQISAATAQNQAQFTGGQNQASIAAAIQPQAQMPGRQNQVSIEAQPQVQFTGSQAYMQGAAQVQPPAARGQSQMPPTGQAHFGAGKAGKASTGFAVPGQQENAGFAFPRQQPPAQPSAEAHSAAPGQAENGKAMSMFYLLQHYNKENAEIYKAQRDAMKGAKKESPKESKKETVKKEKGLGKKKEKNAQSTMASNSGFAIPGQQAAQQAFPQPSAQAAQQASAQYRGGQAVQQASQYQGGQATQQPSSQYWGGQAAQQPSAQYQGGQAAQQASQYQGGQATHQASAQYQGGQTSQQPIQQTGEWYAGENFGDTIVMGANGYGEDTVVLDAMQAAVLKPCLLRCSNNERIMLEKEVFRIGKERSYVDYCISDNRTISRSHADIIQRNGQFYIVDNNSTNHTYVNGERIPSNQEVALTHGMKIRLADEEFEFRMF